jgi:hypothetical protein
MLLLRSLKYKRNYPRKWHYGSRHMQKNIPFTVWHSFMLRHLSYVFFSACHMCLPWQHVAVVGDLLHLLRTVLKYISRIASYLRLVVLAVGFQHTAKTRAGLCRDSAIVLKSVHAAREVIQIMVERLYPTGNLRFALEANFLYVSFAAAFLINVRLSTSLDIPTNRAIAIAAKVPASSR